MTYYVKRCYSSIKFSNFHERTHIGIEECNEQQLDVSAITVGVWGYNNFIKVDTDGFDFKVIRSAENTLKTYKSTLFFEWDLFFLQAQNENPTSIFTYLNSLGYTQLLIFDNFGNLLVILHSDDIQNLSLILDYTRKSNKHIYYYDVLALHKDTPLDAWECAKLL